MISSPVIFNVIRRSEGMDTFGRLLHGAVGTVLGAVGADESIGDDNNYYHFVPDEYMHSRYLQEESNVGFGPLRRSRARFWLPGVAIWADFRYF